MNMAKELVKATTTALVAPTYDYGEDAGEGFLHGAGDMTMPFLAVLQTNSPQLQEIDGAKAGQIFNTVTREVSNSAVVLPVHKRIAYVEWVPRDNGGGFVAVHEPNSKAVTDAIAANGGKRFGKIPIGSNELVETHEVYCLLLDDAGEEPIGFALIAFTSTKIKASKAWYTSMQMLLGPKGPDGLRRPPPTFAVKTRLKTKPDKNKKGQNFFNVVLTPYAESWASSLIDPTSPLFAAAKQFRDTVIGGTVKATYDKMSSDDSEESTASDPPF